MPKRSIPPAQREQLINQIAEMTAAGESVGDITRALGVSRSTVNRYRGLARRRSRELVPISVAEFTESPARCSLVTPDGFRFEGLDVDAAAELWRALR